MSNIRIVWLKNYKEKLKIIRLQSIANAHYQEIFMDSL